MIESLISLFNQLEPNQTQESIDNSWNQLKMLYKNKSTIQSLIQIYDNSTEPLYRFQSLYGINSCLVQSFIHFNQNELYEISSKIVEMYLNEEDDFFKSKIAEIICYLLDRTQQSWTNLDHLIFQCHPCIPNYMKILFHYSILFRNNDLIMLKVQQCFNYDLKTQLEGFELLLFFIENTKKNYSLFVNKIVEMIELIFTSNDISSFNIFLLIYSKFFSKVYPFCKIFNFITNLNNEELHPSILISLRDFLNSNFERMIEYQIQIGQRNIDDNDQYFNDIITDIFAREIDLTIHLFSIEIDEMTTTSDTFCPLLNFLPQEMVENTAYELANSGDIPSTLTSIALFSAYIQKYGGCEENFDFFMSYFNTTENTVSTIALGTLLELKGHFKKFFQPSLIEFLMNWIGDLKSDESDKNSHYLIHNVLVHMSYFIEVFDDVPPQLLSDIFEFGMKILDDAIETEMRDVLFLFHFSILNCHSKSGDISELFSQIIQIVFQLIDQSDFDDIIYLSYSVLTSVLFADKSLFEPYLDSILSNFSNVYSLKFIATILAFFEEKVEPAVKDNLQKIVDVCNTDLDDPVKILSAFQTEVTLFTYYEAKIDLTSSIFDLLAYLIQNSTEEMTENIINTLRSLFNCLYLNDGEFDPNSISPFLTKFLGQSFDLDKFVLDVVALIAGIYADAEKFDTSPFYGYVLNQIGSIFQSKKANLFEQILNHFCNFLNDTIEFSTDEIIEKVAQLAFHFFGVNNQIVRVVCLNMFLCCGQKIDLHDENFIESVIDCIVEDSNDSDDLSNEIACNAAKLVRTLFLENQELVSKYSHSIIEYSLKKLDGCNDKELSDNLIFILINLSPFYADDEELDEAINCAILNSFPVTIENSLFECCYDWLIKKLDQFSEDIRNVAFQAIVKFIVCDLTHFFEEKDISDQLLIELFNVAVSLPKQLISESLDDDQDLLKVFDSNMEFINSLMK